MQKRDQRPCATLAGERNNKKSKRTLNLEKDEKRAVKGFKNLWFSENIIAPFLPWKMQSKKVLYLPGSPASLS
jgi:hypothetical protein